MSKHILRAGDHVRHIPSGRAWVVVWANYETGYLVPAGWPPGQAKIADCEVLRVASDAEHQEFLDRLGKATDYPEATTALAMYRPRPPASDIRELAGELAKWVAELEEEFAAGGGEVWHQDHHSERVQARALIARAKAAGLLP